MDCAPVRKGASAAALVGTPVTTLIPPCTSCHARGTGGTIKLPLLTGQYSNHTADQFRAYRLPDRRTDVYARMRTIAVALTDAQVAELAAHYAAAYR